MRRRAKRSAGLRHIKVRAACAILVLFHTSHAQALTVAVAPITFLGVTLDGADQNVNGTTSAWQIDATGETGGWNLTVASTDFTNGAADSIPVSGLSIRLLDSNIVLVSGDPNGPFSTQTTFATLSASPLKIASAAAGDGDGVYDATPDFMLVVPAESYTGNYTATVAVDVAVGP